jgi:hypothetical protein
MIREGVEVGGRRWTTAVDYVPVVREGLLQQLYQ